jgi:peroxiredoxin
LADYAQLWEKIRAAGAHAAGVAVDAPERSESVRRNLQLPFSILCDVKREIVRSWGVLDSLWPGGIAKPAVFILGSDRRVRFVSVDRERSRVPAATVVDFLARGIDLAPPKPARRAVFPRLADWKRSMASAFHFGFRSPKS